MKMAARLDELSWDYNGSDLENTPLLARFKAKQKQAPLANRDEVVLSREQLELMLQCFEESSNMLKANLLLASTSVNVNNDYTINSYTPSTKKIQPINTRCRMFDHLNACADWMPLWMVLIQAIMVVAGALTGETSSPNANTQSAITAISVCISCGSLILWVTIFAKTIRDLYDRRPSLWQLSMVYVCGVLVFASIYIATFEIQETGWTSAENDNEKKVNYAVKYGQFLYYAVCIGTMHGSSQLYPTSWHTKIVVALQMSLSLIQLCIVIIVSTRRFWTKTPRENINIPRHDRDDYKGDVCSSQEIGASYDFDRTTPLFQDAALYGSTQNSYGYSVTSE